MTKLRDGKQNNKCQRLVHWERDLCRGGTIVGFFVFFFVFSVGQGVAASVPIRDWNLVPGSESSES